MQWLRAAVLLGAAAAGTAAAIFQYRAWRRSQAASQPEPVGQEEEQANAENDTETAPTRTRRSTRIVARQVNRRTYVFLELFLVIIATLLALLASVSSNMMVLAAFLLWIVLRILATTTPLSTGFDVIQEEQEEEKEEEEQEILKPTVGIDGVPDSLEPHRFLGLVSEADKFETIPLIETSFPFKFEDVIDSFFDLFGSSHFPTAVVQHDSSRSPDDNPSTQFRRRKILHPINVPFLLRSLARGLDGIEIDERSVTDADRRTASVYSRNTNCRSIAIIFEQLVIRPHPSNPSSTLMTRTCSLSVRMQSSLRVAVEHALRAGFAKKAADANQALQALVEERRQHRSDIDRTIE